MNNQSDANKNQSGQEKQGGADKERGKPLEKPKGFGSVTSQKGGGENKDE